MRKKIEERSVRERERNNYMKKCKEKLDRQLNSRSNQTFIFKEEEIAVV